MADNRGGARTGAGRKRGTANRLTREIAERAMQEGITPLEVMLNAMRESYEAHDYEEATKYAVMAAPYIHPRLSSITAQHDHRAELVVIDEFGDNLLE